MLVRHLIEHGRRRIGLVIGDHGFGDPDPRERGWRRALQSAGLSDGPIVRVPWTRQGGYAGLGALLAEDPELDAVFASNDLHGVGVLRALHERGLAVPGDVAVVSFDGSVESEFCWPPLTVARQPIAALARAVIDLLDTPETPEGVHIELPTELIRRQSCGCDGTAVDEPRVEVLTRPRRHE
jgi:LacI family transcriptional regulator